MREVARRDLRFSGMLRSVVWRLVSDISGQPIGPVFEGEAVQLVTRCFSP